MSNLYVSPEIRAGYDTCRSLGLPSFEVDQKSVAQPCCECHARSSDVFGRDEIVQTWSALNCMSSLSRAPGVVHHQFGEKVVDWSPFWRRHSPSDQLHRRYMESI